MSSRARFRPEMSQTATTTQNDLDGVVRAIRDHGRFTVVTHENPDGDALGSLLATSLALGSLGKDVVMYLAGDAPLPAEYRFLGLAELRRSLPEDAEDRVLLAVDCANARRIGESDEPLARAALVVDVDHHHDNSRFGNVNLVVADASSTAEIVRDVLRQLDAELTEHIPDDLGGALRRARHRHRSVP